jgi:hypothetical protein
MATQQTDPMGSSLVTIPSRYQGPPDTANGGYVVGLLATPLGPSATVRLETAVPLATPLRLEVDTEETSLWADDRRLAVGHPHDGPAAPIDPVDRSLAAATVGVTAEEHAFPGCFVCGPSAPDGLHLCAGPIPDGSALATVWTPDPEAAGLDVDRLTWAALDCPSGMAAMQTGGAAVLGTLTGRIARPLVAGEPLVVVGRLLRTEGRKRFAGTALYADDGEPVAWSETVWISVER